MRCYSNHLVATAYYLTASAQMASRKRKALPSSDANFILRLLDEESSGDDSDTLYSSDREDDEESIHQPTSSFQSYTQLPVPLNQPTKSHHRFESYPQALFRATALL